jgi:D-sedoheptulose 7-phosphate isomerase
MSDVFNLLNCESIVNKELLEAVATYQNIINNKQIQNQIIKLAAGCVDALKDNKKIIFAGNGGSYADALHLSAELTGRYRNNREPLASIALAANGSALSAIGNDYGFADVFSRELKAIAVPGDIFIAISTSGNSENILSVIDASIKLGVQTVCLTGEVGGQAKALCECICIPSNQTPRIQEGHILLGHILCSLIELGLN